MTEPIYERVMHDLERHFQPARYHQNQEAPVSITSTIRDDIHTAIDDVFGRHSSAVGDLEALAGSRVAQTLLGLVIPPQFEDMAIGVLKAVAEAARLAPAPAAEVPPGGAESAVEAIPDGAGADAGQPVVVGGQA